MGLQYKEDATCWKVLSFPSKEIRDLYVENSYDGTQYTAKIITAKEILKYKNSDIVIYQGE
jgi:hypothetical protein